MSFAAMEIFASETISTNGAALPSHVKVSASQSAGGVAFQIPATAFGPMLVRALPAANSFIGTGLSSAEAVANLAAVPRQPIPAGQFYDFYAAPGIWVAWSVA